VTGTDEVLRGAVRPWHVDDDDESRTAAAVPQAFAAIHKDRAARGFHAQRPLKSG